MKKLILFLFTATCLNSLCQQVIVDVSFNLGTGFDGNVNSSTLQSDGKIIVVGYFSSFNGTARNSIARLNSDGTLDDTFNPGTGFFGIVNSTILQPDGKIIVGGNFTSFNGVTRNKIVRLNSDGGLDDTFNPGTGFSGGDFVNSITLQPDGKIIVGGDFTSFNGTTRNHIARLNSDGTLDDTFIPGTGFDGSVYSTALQSDGGIIVGGDFTSFNGIARSGVARLNSDGTLDYTFNPGTGFNTVYTTTLQSDEKIIVGGFTSLIGTFGIGRLNSNGSLDATFNPGTGFDGIVYSTALQPDGKIIVGGSFSSFNGSSRNRIARLNSDGTLDASFSPGTGFNGDVVNSNTLQSDGKIIVEGGFSTFNGTNVSQITRLISCGLTIDQTITQTACLSYTSPLNQTYTQSGIYHETLLNQSGCDSVHLTINLTVDQPSNLSFSSAQQLYTSPPFAVQFTNSTANSSNYSFTWDFGDGTTLTSNNATVFHEYLYNGQYTVSLIATSNSTGCSDTITLTDYIFCTGGVSCTHSATINQTSPQQACQGAPLWLTCNNDPSFSYQWRNNGVSISGNDNDSLLVTQSGTYSVIITVNSCPVISNDVTVTILPAPNTPVISETGAIQPCVGGSVSLNTGNYASYNWSTGATSQNISVSNSGVYSVVVTDANGCSASSAPYTLNASFAPSPSVCIVGMDSLTNENRIVWEKPLSLGIDSFYVYKETNVADVYTKIGATNYTDLAVFLDVNSNPSVQAYRYKISSLDTCGIETNLSDFHKTIHLTINQGVGSTWNLIWSHYEGLTFGSYNIYRGTDPSNINLLTTVQSNLNSYTDLTPPTGAVYYQIEVVNPVNCDPTKSINYGVSRSNIVNNGVNGINEESETEIKVYPNPTNDKLTLTMSSDVLGKKYAIIDFSGRVIMQGDIISAKQPISMEHISNGSYFLKINDPSAKTIKIIKQ
jgi:uncharacterized delta-60 repeat protein